MKVVSMLLLSLLLISDCLSQTPPANSPVPQNLTVIQSAWRLEIRNPLMNEDPLDYLDRVTQREIERIREEDLASRQIQRQKQNSGQIISQRRINPLDKKTVPELKPQIRTGGVRAVYIYKAKVRNDGEKEIQALIWDYVFFEPGTGREVGRKRFLSRREIAPGKTRELIIRSVSPPTGTISAADSGKQLRDQYSGRVIVQVIQYADGTLWQAPEIRK